VREHVLELGLLGLQMAHFACGIGRGTHGGFRSLRAGSVTKL
jgi:hypothetical protein